MDLSPVRELLYLFAIASARLMAAAAVTPFLGTAVMQGTVRTALVFTWTLTVYPAVAAGAPKEPIDLLTLIAVCTKEVALGVILGFLGAKLFHIAMSVGYFIDNQRGATMASVFDPLSGEQTSPFGQLIQQVVTVGFVTSGGILLFLGAVYESYVVWPVFTFWPSFPAKLPLLVLEQADEMMRLIVVLAAPIVVTLFLAEFGLGLVNRFAPQLNVFFLAMPIKSVLAAFVLAIYFPWVVQHFNAGFNQTKAVLPAVKAALQ